MEPVELDVSKFSTEIKATAELIEDSISGVLAKTIQKQARISALKLKVQMDMATDAERAEVEAWEEHWRQVSEREAKARRAEAEAIIEAGDVDRVYDLLVDRDYY